MKQDGFTLIEALVAALVIALAFTSLLSFFPSLNRINRGTQEDQTMTLAAKAFMESLREAWSDQERFDKSMLADGTIIRGRTQLGTPAMRCSASLSDPDEGAYTPVQRKRVELSCKAEANTQVFIAEFGRPE